ncbi:MAG: hypothetical protein JW959_12320 [Pirellulales bacterium]|nr:hypothetical protein [Pirellulales bacterium]
MKRIFWTTTIAAAVSLIGWFSGPSRANTPTDYQGPCPNVCIPNYKNFGYFETSWRRWPGERRTEQINSRAVDSEVIRTPDGHEEVPPPKAKSMVPLPPTPSPEQEGPLTLPEGAIVPPRGLLLPGEQPREMPLEPLPDNQTKPLFENGLPDLPDLPAEPKAEPQPKAQSPENSENRRPQSRRWTAPTTRESKVQPLADRMEPERNFRFNVPHRDPAAGSRLPAQTNGRQEGVVPVVAQMEPERFPLQRGAQRADPIDSMISSRPAERVEPAAYAIAESPGTAVAEDEFIVPPLALNGYCPVDLIANGRWTVGDLRWTVVHKGLIYRLGGDRQRREFLADPDRFAPVDSGNDRVMLVDGQSAVPGRVEYCAIYGGRLYMFSSAESQTRFNENPLRYAVGE